MRYSEQKGAEEREQGAVVPGVTGAPEGAEEEPRAVAPGVTGAPEGAEEEPLGQQLGNS